MSSIDLHFLSSILKIHQYFPTSAVVGRAFHGIGSVGGSRAPLPLRSLIGLISGGHAWRLTLAGHSSFSSTNSYPIEQFLRTKDSREFTGLWNCLSTTYKSDGIFGLYRGFTISVFASFLYRASYFGCFGWAKAFFSSHGQRPLKFHENWAIAQVLTVQFILFTSDTQIDQSKSKILW